MTQPANAPPPSWRALLGEGHASRLLVVLGALALHAVSIYVVATIMPIVVGDIGGLAFFAWTTTLYIAGSLSGAASVPAILSRAGPRVTYRLAFALFLTGSLVCSLAPAMGVLLAGRLIQGVGGGMLPALAYATVRAILPPALHARAIALLGGVWGIAAVLGPSIGGVFAQFGAWRAAFRVDLAIGLVVALAAERVLPRRGETNGRRGAFQGWRLALLALAAVAVGVGGITGRFGPAAFGVAGAAALVWVMLRLDTRATARLLPAGAFDPSCPMGAVSATMGLLIISTSPCVFIAYILQAGHGVAPLVAGYANAALALAWTLASLLTAGAAPHGARAAIAAGPPLMLAGLLLDAWALADGNLAGVIAAQAIIGAGIGIGWAHLGALLMAVAPPGERAVAGPFITTTQTLAAAFGSAIAGMVANLCGLASAASRADTAAIAPWLFCAMAVFPIAAGLAAWRTLALTASPRVAPRH